MAEAAVEIACDESGASGDNLQDRQRILVHGSVRLERDEARKIVAEVRRRTGIKGDELKSKALLRPHYEDTRQWLMGSEGPLAGRAKVLLVDKDFLLATKIIDTFAEPVQHGKGVDYLTSLSARDDARLLARLGPRAFGEERWAQFLAGFQSLMRRTLRDGSERTTPEQFFALVNDMRLTSRRRELLPIMALLWEAYPRRNELVAQPVPLVSLDPLMTAVPTTARLWFEELGLPIVLLHDEQSVLSPERIAVILQHLNSPHPYLSGAIKRVPLQEIRLVDSRNDHRIQVAELLAGVARDAANRALNAESNALQIGNFVGSYSIWSDQASWLTLTGRAYV